MSELFFRFGQQIYPILCSLWVPIIRFYMEMSEFFPSSSSSCLIYIQSVPIILTIFPGKVNRKTEILFYLKTLMILTRNLNFILCTIWLCSSVNIINQKLTQGFTMIIMNFFHNHETNLFRWSKTKYWYNIKLQQLTFGNWRWTKNYHGKWKQWIWSSQVFLIMFHEISCSWWWCKDNDNLDNISEHLKLVQC